jgi:hypothetical protein
MTHVSSQRLPMHVQRTKTVRRRSGPDVCLPRRFPAKTSGVLPLEGAASRCETFRLLLTGSFLCFVKVARRIDLKSAF